MTANMDQLKFFANYIEKQIGIIYSDANFFQLEHRLGNIVQMLGLKDIQELWERGRKGIDGQLRDLLLDIATNNETSFFRDAAVFEAFSSKIIPELIENNPGLKKIKIWSAAGSTGQEAYSIAICMQQLKLSNPSLPDYEIFVSDVSERVLAKTQEGTYTQLEVQRGLPARTLIQYFEKVGESSWKAKKELRDRITIKKINLLEGFPSADLFDVVFCRNVLIYQSIENKKIIVEKIVKCMGKQRYFVMGAAESMLGVSNSFLQVNHERAVYYKTS